MELKELQEKLFEMLCFFDKICTKLNLKYYLAYGTLLGAVRHKGFIPWDDDVDVWMPRNDFDKLLNYLTEEHPSDRYFLNTGKYKAQCDRPNKFQMRIVDSKTPVYKPISNFKMEFFLWMDIFALDSYPENKEKKYIKKFKKHLFRYKMARCKNFVLKDGFIKTTINKTIYFLHNKLGLLKKCLIEEKEIEKTYLTLTKYKDDASCNKYFSYAAVYLNDIKKCTFDKSLFDESIRVDFLSEKLCSSSKFDEILTQLYGDYMQLPKEEERITHSIEFIETD